MKDEADKTYNTLYELYETLGLPVGLIEAGAGITVHNLKDVHFELPYKSPVFRPNYFSFIFVKDARGQYTIDDQTFATTPGMVYFTNPSNYRIFEWTEVNDATLITFDESFLKVNLHADIFNEFPFLLTETVAPQVLDKVAFAEMESIYSLIQKEYKRDSVLKFRIIGNLFIVLLLKIKERFWSDYNPIYEGNRSSQIVKGFKRMLEQHYRDLTSGTVQVVNRVQDYADAQGLHPNYLSNVIKSKTGKAIGTWIAEKTIAQAKSLLQNSDISIKEVAFRLGFSEAAHFSTYFKKHTAISPVTYRKDYISATS